MKVAIINKSDTKGGAAVVSMRLLEALRAEGVDARMLVVDKSGDSPYVEPAASRLSIEAPFLAERLKIFMANGFDRSTLFQIDTASDGLPLHRHPVVRDADVVCLNWVNQGMLSLRGIRKIMDLGKPVVWTMHDMWCFTGVCHHAGNCRRFTASCGDCPLLGRCARPSDISHSVFLRKKMLYSRGGITFVAVSHWLADLAAESALPVVNRPLVIPNAFNLPEYRERVGDKEQKTILFGAARLDDPVKGLPILIEATKWIACEHPDIAATLRLVTFGSVRNPDALSGIAIPHEHIGVVPASRIPELYGQADAVVSTSLYETLPGTLVEGQAFGAVPVAFDRGGQRDIVDHLSTGYLARWDDDPARAGAAIGEGLLWAVGAPTGIRRRMYDSVGARFSYHEVAGRYISLFNSLLSKK